METWHSPPMHIVDHRKSLIVYKLKLFFSSRVHSPALDIQMVKNLSRKVEEINFELEQLQFAMTYLYVYHYAERAALLCLMIQSQF
jgi:hypothetical protein